MKRILLSLTTFLCLYAGAQTITINDLYFLQRQSNEDSIARYFTAKGFQPTMVAGLVDNRLYSGWQFTTQNSEARQALYVVFVAVDSNGKRQPVLHIYHNHLYNDFFNSLPDRGYIFSGSIIENGQPALTLTNGGFDIVGTTNTGGEHSFYQVMLRKRDFGETISNPEDRSYRRNRTSRKRATRVHQRNTPQRVDVITL